MTRDGRRQVRIGQIGVGTVTVVTGSEIVKIMVSGQVVFTSPIVVNSVVV